LKKILSIILFLLLSSSAYSHSYKKDGEQYVYKAALRILYEIFKTGNLPVYYGNMYLVPETDPVTKKLMYTEDMRENRKVFMIIVVYQF
jgi:hypothetical protein